MFSVHIISTEFDKMQIPSEIMCARNALAVSVGLATIGVCVFVRLLR